MPADPYIAIWEFIVPPDRTDSFLAVYGPSGRWAQLFRRAAGYRGTELYRDRAVPERFVTLDFWLNEDSWQAFRTGFAEEYESLDRQCEALSTSERLLGSFALADRSQAAL
jgi:heme-degrading monooxygenase HmoA